MRFLVLIAICFSIVSCDGASWRDDDDYGNDRFSSQRRENARRRQQESENYEYQAQERYRQRTTCPYCGNNAGYCKCGTFKRH